jgi:hypothetical protein
MSTTFFCDLQQFSANKPWRSHQGHLRVDAVVTAAKVLKYTTKDGKVLSVLRHPDQVFDPDSLKTLAGLPVTVSHPIENGKAIKVTPQNWKKYGVGITGDSIDVSQNPYVKINGLNIQDAAALATIRDGSKLLSPGYEASLVEECGVFDGVEYTHRQYGIETELSDHPIIVYNHLSIVDQSKGETGRTGENVRLLMDDADILVSIPDNQPKKKMATKFLPIKAKNKKTGLMIDAMYATDPDTGDVTISADDFQKISEMLSGLDTTLDELLDQLAIPDADKPAEELPVGVDSVAILIEKYTENKTELEAIKKTSLTTDSDEFKAAVNNRVKLLDQIKSCGLVIDSTKTDHELKLELIEKYDPSLISDSLTTPEINGMFTAVIKIQEKKNAGIETQAGLIGDATEKDNKEAPKDKAGKLADIRKNMNKARNSRPA